MQTKPSIVFVHGIWADGSSFGKVIPTLETEGYEVVAAQHSLDTLKRRRRNSNPDAGAGQRSGHTRRPLVRRNRRHSRGNR